MNLVIMSSSDVNVLAECRSICHFLVLRLNHSDQFYEIIENISLLQQRKPSPCCFVDICVELDYQLLLETLRITSIHV